MNAEDTQCDPKEAEEEDEQTAQRMEGRPGALKFTAEEYTAWCLPWMNSLIIKVLGANFPTYLIRDRINRMWRPKDPLKLIPLNNGYFIVSFSNREDKEYAFQEGPWMIDDHYLIVQRWRPNFNPWKADLQCNIAAWIRLPDVPFEFYNVESLRRIGNMVGRMIKIDRSTSVYDKGGFARICVEIDLKQPLLPSYKVFGEERAIIYEGLHQVCFECGKYGHHKGVCPLRQNQDQDQIKDKSPTDLGAEGKDGSSEDKEAPVGGAPTVVTGGPGERESSFGKLKILRRDFRGVVNSAELRQGINGELKQPVEQVISGNKIGSQWYNPKKEGKHGVNAVINADINKDKIKAGDTQKTEWIKVGAKRKSVITGRIPRGKENKGPARVKANDKSHKGQGLEFNQANSFQVLQEVEPNICLSTPITCSTDKDKGGSSHVKEDSTMETPYGLTSSAFLNLMGPAVEDGNLQVDILPHHQPLDEDMKDQDKSEGELEVPQHPQSVSQ
ncbi:hypothetical protein K1719_001527 [Acacia pycnantha]|nr:hypothetical protein K1719_001527 [Acacia pycnantha]